MITKLFYPKLYILSINYKIKIDIYKIEYQPII
jgi:hypothetical protein